MAQRNRAGERPVERHDQEVQPSAARILGLQVLRRRRGKIPQMSQGVLADLAGVAENTVANIENSADPNKPAHNAKVQNIEAIATALGCSAADLLTWDAEVERYAGVAQW